MQPYTVTFIVKGEEIPVTAPGDTTLGAAKAKAGHGQRLARDASGFLLNDHSLLCDMVERDGVLRVFLTAPSGAVPQA